VQSIPGKPSRRAKPEFLEGGVMSWKDLTTKGEGKGGEKNREIKKSLSLGERVGGRTCVLQSQGELS